MKIWPLAPPPPPPVALAAVRSTAMDLLLMIHCLLLLRLFCGGGCVLSMFVMSFLVLQSNYLAGEESAGCFTLIAF